MHPNDHVNASQSSNDVFPSAVHLAVVESVALELIPARRAPAGRRSPARRGEFRAVVKSGRTHLMDATPVTLGQEIGGLRRPARRGGRAPRAACCPRVGQLPARRHGGRHRHQRAPHVRPQGDRRARRAHRPAPQRGPRPLRRPGRPRRPGRGVGRAAGPGRGPHQDRQRPALDGVGPPHRPGRDPPPRPPARLVDHAGQGEPGAVRGGHPGGGPGRSATTPPSPSAAARATSS